MAVYSGPRGCIDSDRSVAFVPSCIELSGPSIFCKCAESPPSNMPSSGSSLTMTDNSYEETVESAPKKMHDTLGVLPKSDYYEYAK